MTYDTNQLTRASAINMPIRRLLMEVATFWQIGEKRVCTGGHESDGYPWLRELYSSMRNILIDS